MRTYSATARDAEASREWYVVDATGKTLGRLATRLRMSEGQAQADLHAVDGLRRLRGRRQCRKVRVTGRKLDQKIYYRFSGYPGRLDRDQPARSD